MNATENLKESPSAGETVPKVPTTVTEQNSVESPDYRVALLSMLGVAGFIFGCIIIFFPDFIHLKRDDFKLFHRNNRRAVFHEIEYQPRTIARNLIEHSISQLNDSIITRRNEIKLQDSSIEELKKKSADSKALEESKNSLVEKNKKDSIKINTLAEYKSYYEDASKNDTSTFQKLNNALHFEVTPDSIYSWNTAFSSEKNQWNASVTYYFKNDKTPFSITGKEQFNILHFDSDVEFISKYPAAGVWVLMVLIFCSFSFIAISNSIHLNSKIITDDNQITIASRKQYFIIAAITFLVLVILASIWNLTFYDEEVVKNIYFLSSLSVTVKAIFFLGYATGAFCLAGFIYNAAMLTYVSKNIKANKETLLNKQADFELDKTNVNLQGEIDTIKSTIADKKIAFGNLLTYFNDYFILSAIILSLMVLCTGALFGAVNSLDFIKLLQDDWGYSPARPDFVYLYAGIHTVILSLIYVPAKIRFNEIRALFDGAESTGQAGGVDETGGQSKGRWYDFLKDPLSTLKGTLLAVSPLIASLVQALVNMLFNQ